LEIRHRIEPRRSAAMEERGAEDRRRVERAALDRVDDQEPDGNRGRADEACDQALLVEPRDIMRCERRLLGVGRTLGARAGLSRHHPSPFWVANRPVRRMADYTAELLPCTLAAAGCGRAAAWIKAHRVRRQNGSC